MQATITRLADYVVLKHTSLYFRPKLLITSTTSYDFTNIEICVRWCV